MTERGNYVLTTDQVKTMYQALMTELGPSRNDDPPYLRGVRLGVRAMFTEACGWNRPPGDPTGVELDLIVDALNAYANECEDGSMHESPYWNEAQRARAAIVRLGGAS
jgi:hypothetical protein